MSDDQPGTLGTTNSPLIALYAEELDLDAATVAQLLGLEFGTTPSAEGHIAFDGDSGTVDGEVTAVVNGEVKTIDAIEVHRPDGTVDEIAEWHRGPRVFFAVEITGTNSPVEEGNILTVDADITNTGAAQGTQTIYLRDSSGTALDVQTVTVAKDATESVALEWQTESGDAGAGQTVTVESDDDSDTTQVTVESSVPDIPTEGLLHHYDAMDDSTITESNGDVTQWDDKAGAENLTGTVSGGLGTINGSQAIGFDGSNDRLSVNFGTTVTQPVETFYVSQSNDNGDRQIVADGYNNAVMGRASWPPDANEPSCIIYAGNNSIVANDLTQDPELRTLVYDGLDSEIRKNGSFSADDPNISIGDNDYDGLTVGAVREGSAIDHVFDGHIGEVALYDPSANGYNRDDVESALLSRWGIS